MAAMRSCSAPSCSVSLACRSRSVCTRALGSAPRPAGLRVAHRHARLVVRRGSEGEGVEGAESGASKSVLSRENPDLVERFAVVGGGSAECKSCQYVYEPKLGDPEYPVAKGTLFQDLPPDWRCPTCGAEKKLFVSKAKVVAGFSQNQGYGMGTNSMTSEQKSLLIYGTMAAFFAMFIAGYLLD